MKLYIVDAFTDTLFGGNTAGVAFVDGEWPSDERMTLLARELRYSETVFVRRTDSGFALRYFTPAAEVDLCGHATVGAFVAMKEEGLERGVYPVTTRSGDINVAVGDSVLMDMAPPEFIGAIPEERIEEFYGAFGLSSALMAPGLPPEMISTGLPDIMLSVADEAALAALAPDFPLITDLSREYGVVGVHVFCPSADATAHCRNFAPLYDIPEESATGTSNGALTYYLWRHGRVTPEDENAFIQGEAMGRPSVIRTRLSVENETAVVRVGGGGVVVLKGDVRL